MARRKPTPFEKALKVRFRDGALLETALTHRSFAFEQDVLPTNERLEFLGDSVLGLVVTDLAFRAFPGLPEGDLAKLRAATVSMTTLAEVARELDLGQAIRLGKGEEMSGGRDKASILADAMEAVLGAVYIDQGLPASFRLIERLFWPRVTAYRDGQGERDFKTLLQELSTKDIGRLPEYRVSEHGPDHQKEFTATVFLGGRRLGSGVGRSKKEAEQGAAREAFERLTAGERRSAPESAGDEQHQDDETEPHARKKR